MPTDRRFAVWPWYAHARIWLVQRPFVVKWREQRYRDFVTLCGVEAQHRIVDVGSGGTAVSGTLGRFNANNPIVALDLVARDGMSTPNATFVRGDATEMPFADNEFDVAFCNSLIEHLRSDEQHMLAHEVRRVASGYWVQTPNRYFPIEPHQLIPGYQFLPRCIRRFVDSLDEGRYTELLSRSDLQALFPEASIYEERVSGIVKSIAAWVAPSHLAEPEAARHHASSTLSPL